MVCFNRHNSAEEWRVGEWQTFTGGMTSYLTFGGRLHLGFNARRGHRGDSRYYDAATAEWWRRCMAETRAQSVTMLREGVLEAFR